MRLIRRLYADARTLTKPPSPSASGHGSPAIGYAWEVEVLVLMEDDEPGAVGDRGDEQVWHRWRAVVTAIGEDGEDLDGTLFGSRRGVFDWHRDDWRLA